MDLGGHLSEQQSVGGSAPDASTPVHSQTHSSLGNQHQLFIGENRGVTRFNDPLFGHAVETAHVAAVSHRQAQSVYLPS